MYCLEDSIQPQEAVISHAIQYELSDLVYFLPSSYKI